MDKLFEDTVKIILAKQMVEAIYPPGKERQKALAEVVSNLLLGENKCTPKT